MLNLFSRIKTFFSVNKPQTTQKRTHKNVEKANKIGKNSAQKRRQPNADAPKSTNVRQAPPRSKGGGVETKSKRPERTERPPRTNTRPAKGNSENPPSPPKSENLQTQIPWDAGQFSVEAEEGKVRFHDFNLPNPVMHGIFDLGFKYCTPIQAASLEKSLSGANVAGRAQTGTGKTAAYLLTILTRHLRTRETEESVINGAPRALVIAPTRELCVQIARDAQTLGKYCNLRSMAIFGGMDYAKQARELQGSPLDLLAATPGRLLDFQRQRIVDLSRIDTLVIDEADRMLDMGFIPDVRRIIRALPIKRQTLLYSATLNDEVMRLAAQWMPNPVKVEIEPEQVSSATIEQKVLIVTSNQKFTVLCNLLARYKDQRVLVFGNRRASVETLSDRLRRHGFESALLSGDVSQAHRMKVLDNFRSGKSKLVVATDVAGRGLHIADIGLVVNFELPYEAEDYVHRIGRTGRAGQVGTAVSFACEDESFVIPDIEKYLGEELCCIQPDEELLKPLRETSRRARGAKSDSAVHERTGDTDVPDAPESPPDA